MPPLFSKSFKHVGEPLLPHYFCYLLFAICYCLKN